MDTVTKMDSKYLQGLFFSSSGTREGLGTKVAKSLTICISRKLLQAFRNYNAIFLMNVLRYIHNVRITKH